MLPAWNVVRVWRQTHLICCRTCQDRECICFAFVVACVVCKTRRPHIEPHGWRRHYTGWFRRSGISGVYLCPQPMKWPYLCHISMISTSEVLKCAEINCTYFENICTPLHDVNLEIKVPKVTLQILLLNSIVITLTFLGTIRGIGTTAFLVSCRSLFTSHAITSITLFGTSAMPLVWSSHPKCEPINKKPRIITTFWLKL